MSCWLSWTTPCQERHVCKVRILSGRILQNNKTFPSLSESLPISSESRVASLYEFHCLGSLEINEGIYFGTCQSILRTHYGLVVRHGLDTQMCKRLFQVRFPSRGFCQFKIFNIQKNSARLSLLMYARNYACKTPKFALPFLLVET